MAMPPTIMSIYTAKRDNKQYRHQNDLYRSTITRVGKNWWHRLSELPSRRPRSRSRDWVQRRQQHRCVTNNKRSRYPSNESMYHFRTITSNYVWLAMIGLAIIIIQLPPTTQAWSLSSSSSSLFAKGGGQKKSKKKTSSCGGGGGGFGKPSSTGGGTVAKKKNPKSNAPSPPRRSFIPDTSPTIQSLIQWLDDEEIEGLDGTSIGYQSTDDGGDNDDDKGSGPLLRGVFAKRDFQPGEYIIAVPFVSTLLVDERTDESTTNSANGGKTPPRRRPRADEPQNGIQFMKKFLWDPQQNQKFKHYLDTIPQAVTDPNFAMTPDFWPTKYIEKIGSTKVTNDILKRRTDMEHIVSTANSKNNNDNDITFDTLQFAAWLVRTRAFTTFKKTIDPVTGNEGLLSRVILIPYLDMMNHAPTSLSNDSKGSSSSIMTANAELQVVETKEYDESFYALVATQPIQKNEQICITYGTGEESSVDIFIKYGFLPTFDERQKIIDTKSFADDDNALDEDSLLDTGIEEGLIQDLGELFTDDDGEEDDDSDDYDDDDEEDEEAIRKIAMVKSLLDLRIRMKSTLLE